MKSLGSDKSAAKSEKSTSTEAAASEGDNNGFKLTILMHLSTEIAVMI